MRAHLKVRPYIIPLRCARSDMDGNAHDNRLYLPFWRI